MIAWVASVPACQHKRQATKHHHQHKPKQKALLRACHCATRPPAGMKHNATQPDTHAHAISTDVCVVGPGGSCRRTTLSRGPWAMQQGAHLPRDWPVPLLCPPSNATRARGLAQMPFLGAGSQPRPESQCPPGASWLRAECVARFGGAAYWFILSHHPPAAWCCNLTPMRVCGALWKGACDESERGERPRLLLISNVRRP